MEEDYMKLFEEINKQQNNNGMIKETPNYGNLQSINETPNTQHYNINENLNDGWDLQFETVINGVKQSNNNPYQQAPSRRRTVANDPNGLGQYMDDDNMNEVYRAPQQSAQLPQAPVLNETYDTSVITVELFEKMNQHFFLSLAQSNDFKSWIK